MGCMGETAAFAILLGAAWLLIRKTADWRLMLGTLGGALLLNFVLNVAGAPRPIEPFWGVLAGGFLFGAVFMVTDPVSSARTDAGRWIYGTLVGMTTVLNELARSMGQPDFYPFVMSRPVVAKLQFIDLVVRDVRPKHRIVDLPPSVAAPSSRAE